MREIKFRAWLNPTKQMAKVTEIKLEGENTFRVLTPDNQVIWFGGENPNAIVMQFTGLLDKNGKPIYEGDIIRYNIGLHYPTSISSIEFLNGWFKRYKEGGTDILQYTENYAEIIGNIYENSALLEEATV